MNTKPMGNKVIVRPKKKEEKTESGLILPDSVGEKPQTGQVLAVGPGGQTLNGTDYKMSVKEGDEVLYAKFTGTEVNVEGEDVLIMPETDILAVLEDN